MKEIVGNLWDSKFSTPDYVRIITTNGFVKKDGSAVMGRGCAREAVYRWPALSAVPIPSLPMRLGAHIKARGNICAWMTTGLITFPVKHAWYEPADLELIGNSAVWLKREADNLRQKWFVLPRPGCGNGQLNWEDVKPLIKFLPDNVLVIDFA